MAVTLWITTTSLVFSQRVRKRGKRLKEIGWGSGHFEKPFLVLNLSLSLFVNHLLFSWHGPSPQFIYIHSDTSTAYLAPWHIHLSLPYSHTLLPSLPPSLSIILTMIMNSWTAEKKLRRATRHSQCFCCVISLWFECLWRLGYLPLVSCSISSLFLSTQWGDLGWHSAQESSSLSPIVCLFLTLDAGKY